MYKIVLVRNKYDVVSVEDTLMDARKFVVDYSEKCASKLFDVGTDGWHELVNGILESLMVVEVR